MNIILFTINVLIISSSAHMHNVFRNQEILDNENDPNRNTIHGEFIVFFDIDCVNDNIIQNFVDNCTCYELNQDVQDLFPDIVDRWIRMDRVANCDEIDVFVELDDYCIIGVQVNEMIQSSGSNQCLSRPVESELYNLNTASPAITDGVQYIQFDSTYNPNLDIIVMDSGIDESHEQFSGITIERIFDAYPSETVFSHGTHCGG